jgi:hypothetical protein
LLRYGSQDIERLVLSIQNLSSSNLDFMLARLNKTFDKSQRSKMILKIPLFADVELAQIRQFATAGYRVFYVLPDYRSGRCAKDLAARACIQLRNEHHLKAEDVESVSRHVHPLVRELTGKKTPQVGLEGKFSVYHSSAVAIIHGAAGEAQYSDQCVRDPRVIGLRDRVTATVDRTVYEDQARISIQVKSGKTLEKFVEHAVGSKDRPISDADLEAKFRGLTDGILSNAETDNLIRLCWDIGKLRDAGDVARASVPQAMAVPGF